MGKIIEVRELYNDTIKAVTESEDKWLSFLKTASWNFKYDFNDKILIYAQRPNATACAEINEWNEKVHRWVNKGANYIFVFSKNENSKYPFRFVFDVADTHNYKNTPYKLWEIKPDYESKIIESLEAKFGEIVKESDFGQAIIAITNNMVMDTIQDYMATIIKYKKETTLEKLSDSEIESVIYQTIFSSVSYMILSRCGINPDKYLSKKEFTQINKFNSSNLTILLGNAISDIAEMGLREIAKTVINLQKEEKNKNHTFVKSQKEGYSNNEEKIEGGNEDDEDRIHESRGLQHSEHNNGTGELTNREIRKNEITLFEGEQQRRVYNTINEQEVSQTLSRNTRNGNKDDKSNSRENGETRGNNRGTKSTRPNEMDRTNEQLQADGRGTSNEGIDLHLELPTEEEQKQSIAEAENASVFSFEQEVIDTILQSGSGVVDGKFRIYEQFSKSLSSEENVKFLKNEYGIGGSSGSLDKGISEWHDSKGITLENRENFRKLQLSWLQVEKRIRELISYDRYLNNQEKDEYFDWLDIKGIPNPDTDIQNQIKHDDYKLAEKLYNFIKDYDFYSYIVNVPIENTDEENIELIRADINDELNIKNYIDFLMSTLEDTEDDEEQEKEVKELLEKLEERLPYYEYDKGDIVYIGTKEYSIIEIDSDKVLVVDANFPILVEEFARKDFDKKIRENPANDKLRTGKRVQSKKEENKNISGNEQEETKEQEYYEGKIVYLESGKKFKINEIDNEKGIISLLDLQLASFMPIFREESIENFERLYYDNPLNSVQKDGNTKDNEQTENEQKEKTKVDTTEQKTETKQESNLKANIKTKRRNKIEYYDLHPEIALKDRNNYKITDNALGEGNKKEKYKRNIKAIKILKQCESENRYATLEEQEILASYIGWGGLQEVFDPTKDEWANEYKELSSLLTEKEYKKARRTTLSAFYTPPIVINAIYKALERMGLEKGNILEPSCRCG